MKLKYCLVVLVCALACIVPASAQTNKPLVAYFSWSGNTKQAAQEIAAETGADIFEITPAKAYSSSYSSVAAQAKAEQDSNARPALASKVSNIAQYTTIFIGFPVWYYDIPMLIHTFLESYDFTGKTIIPFCTESSSGFTQSVASIKKECPHSTLLDGFEGKSWSNSAQNQANIRVWLAKLGY
jgi:flavodoxin